MGVADGQLAEVEITRRNCAHAGSGAEHGVGGLDAAGAGPSGGEDEYRGLPEGGLHGDTAP